jgi:hypothetical protein
VKNSSLGTKDVKNGALLAGDFKSGQLPQGSQGPQGPQGVQGVQGDDGLQGPAGTARAYANVRRTCDVAAPNLCPVGHSQGVAQVTRPATGTYCVQVPGISSDNVPAVASPELVGSLNPGGHENVYVARDAGAPCPNGEFAVYTYDGGILANNQAFNIVIP